MCKGGEKRAKGKYSKWLEPESLALLEGWARNGLTDEQIAHNMGISRSTLNDWRGKYSDISNAIKNGKEVTDFIVENALFKSATGEVKTIRKPIKVKTEKSVPGKGKIIEERIEYADEQIYIPPQVTAQIFWLKNRKASNWKDKPDGDNCNDALQERRKG